MIDDRKIKDTESFRDSIATVNEKGGRIWIYPKKPKGWYYDMRTYVSYALLFILFGLPFIKINGEPFILLNVLERHFILFGVSFAPQDFYLFALAMVTGVLFIILFTVIFGRLFCGWVCPQTIFMEMVFRKVEYWIEGDGNAQRRLAKAPWNADKIKKKTLKHGIFIFISILIAHTFLSYIIGADAVWRIISSSPTDNLSGFVSMVVFTIIFYGVFSVMREQVCITICPYGRLQGVLLDKNSIAVIYDWVRGEPRGKMQKKKKVVPKKKEHECKKTCVNCQRGGSCVDDILNKIEKDVTAAAQSIQENTVLEPTLTFQPVVEKKVAKLGDCIDCTLCVQVCPTGIDIRNGTQLECINCTACMDACDDVMIKIGREPGLIRYDSHNGIVETKRKIFTTRAIAYSVVLLTLLLINTALLTTRNEVDILLMRTPGMLFQKNEDGTISNLYNYQIINKTHKDIPIEFKLIDTAIGSVRTVGKTPVAKANEQTKGSLFIDLDREFAKKNGKNIRVEIWSEGKMITKTKTNFFGPK